MVFYVRLHRLYAFPEDLSAYLRFFVGAAHRPGCTKYAESPRRVSQLAHFLG